MNVLVVLSAILFILMVLIGGRKGLRSFISLFLNFAVLILTVFFLLDPAMNPIILILIACAIISCINLFYINEVNSKTKTAFLSTVITIVFLVLLIYIMTDKLMIQGFSEEQVEELSTLFSLYIGLDFVKIAAAMIIVSTIGAITDVAISITSPMQEIFDQNPGITKKDLFISGIRIGRDILGSNTNTLFFAFFGGYLALLLWVKDMEYSIGEIANSKIFTSELLIILSAGIGIAMIIPIASWINSYYLVKKREQDALQDE
ncbi:YibE/F family protein [Oceanobacillus sp. AG]|uniref:YibE/F family protein n=1 Tax=Oceanobacillus sp. AG TaxID=2681969 RepID=UPI0012EB1CE0|nr:YibE/F family protein [Oceanobacillus sp. AG]